MPIRRQLLSSNSAFEPRTIDTLEPGELRELAELL